MRVGAQNQVVTRPVGTQHRLACLVIVLIMGDLHWGFEMAASV